MPCTVTKIYTHDFTYTSPVKDSAEQLIYKLMSFKIKSVQPDLTKCNVTYPLLIYHGRVVICEESFGGGILWMEL